jgi:hypothetical protein
MVVYVNNAIKTGVAVAISTTFWRGRVLIWFRRRTLDCAELGFEVEASNGRQRHDHTAQLLVRAAYVKAYANQEPIRDR